MRANWICSYCNSMVNGAETKCPYCGGDYSERVITKEEIDEVEVKAEIKAVEETEIDCVRESSVPIVIIAMVLSITMIILAISASYKVEQTPTTEITEITEEIFR